MKLDEKAHLTFPIVAQVNSGIIKGKGLSGTIKGGISVIDIINNGQTVVVAVRSFGSTTEGSPFLIEENGIGSQADNFARLVCDFLNSKQVIDLGNYADEKRLGSEHWRQPGQSYQPVSSHGGGVERRSKVCHDHGLSTTGSLRHQSTVVGK